jgi:hypothetical protein
LHLKQYQRAGTGTSVDQGPRTRKKSILFLDWALSLLAVTLFFVSRFSFALLNITTLYSRLTCIITLLLHLPSKVRPLIIAPLVMIARCSWVMRALNLLDSAPSHRGIYIYVAPSSKKVCVVAGHCSSLKIQVMPSTWASRCESLSPTPRICPPHPTKASISSPLCASHQEHGL